MRSNIGSMRGNVGSKKASYELFTIISKSERTAQELDDLLRISNNINLEQINQKGETLMILAVHHNSRDKIEVLLKYGASINGSNTPNIIKPIHFCGNRSLLAFMISKGVDINALDGDNQSMLHLACKSGIFEVARELLAHGIKLNLQDSKGNTAKDILQKNIFARGLNFGVIRAANEKVEDYSIRLYKEGKLDVVLANEIHFLFYLNDFGAKLSDEIGSNPAFSDAHQEKIQIVSDLFFLMGAEYKNKVEEIKREYHNLFNSYDSRHISASEKDRKLLQFVSIVTEFVLNNHNPLLEYVAGKSLTKELEIYAESSALVNVAGMFRMIANSINLFSKQIRAENAEILPFKSNPWFRLEEFGALVTNISLVDSSLAVKDDNFVVAAHDYNNAKYKDSIYRLMFESVNRDALIEQSFADIIKTDLPELKKLINFMLSKSKSEAGSLIDKISLDNVTAILNHMQINETFRKLLLFTLSHANENLDKLENIPAEEYNFLVKPIASSKLENDKAKYSLLWRLHEIGELLNENHLPSYVKDMLGEEKLKYFRMIRDAISHPWERNNYRVFKGIVEQPDKLNAVSADLKQLHIDILELIGKYYDNIVFSEDLSSRWQNVRDFFAAQISSYKAKEIVTKNQFIPNRQLLIDAEIEFFLNRLRNPVFASISEKDMTLIKQKYADILQGKKSFDTKITVQDKEYNISVLFPSKKENPITLKDLQDQLKRASTTYDLLYQNYINQANKKNSPVETIEKYSAIKSICDDLSSYGRRDGPSKLEKVEIVLEEIDKMKSLLRNELGINLNGSRTSFFIDQHHAPFKIMQKIVDDQEFNDALHYHYNNALEITLKNIIKYSESEDRLKYLETDYVLLRDDLNHGAALLDSQNSQLRSHISHRQERFPLEIIKFIFDVEAELNNLKQILEQKKIAENQAGDKSMTRATSAIDDTNISGIGI